ncbi:hypothetical protein HX870_32275 [Pseudomonas gingeri]|uniref:hypothetical protein n=1 Tax=Pseudomonas gingeri TaxID=117681 RepID=UPI0015A39220|nr:hypothetical protein [Pseudomonas gingeri]NWD72290.1 hypothetical protein [Pseudomonas gingeri]
MSDELGLLFDKVARYDLVFVKVVDAPRPQVLRAKVERIYTSRKGIYDSSLGSEIEFVRSGGTWGDVALNVGDQAILFVKLISGELYEDAWRGHMVVEEIEGELYAIFHHKELWLSESIPSSIVVHSRQDPKRSYATAIRFDVMEAYLLSLIEEVNNNEGGI